MKRLKLPFTDREIKSLKAGEEFLLSGTVYTARDTVHKILTKLLKDGKRPPIPLKDKAIYYTGPTPPPPGKVIGSCGPTTSARMDVFTPMLLENGLRVMIGKGGRSKAVKESIKKHKALYLLAPAGCGALLSKKIKKMTLVAYKDLGPEAIYELLLSDFPVIVGIDARGNDIFKIL
ncbi:MAG: fumarate hydratase C-terminal domain-containing protein [Candidatus Omnitrophica bacterium]|nr:fumarate hydratase C-terminal domain-containing protein [Candidatus Omnitrophota bacterium]